MKQLIDRFCQGAREHVRRNGADVWTRDVAEFRQNSDAAVKRRNFRQIPLRSWTNHANRHSHRHRNARPLASEMVGARYRLAVPLSLANLTGASDEIAEELVVYDDLGAGIGSRIAFSEGGEAAQPFRPERQAGRRLQRRDPRPGRNGNRNASERWQTRRRMAEHRSEREDTNSHKSVGTAATYKTTYRHISETKLMINAHQIKEEICDIGRRIYNKGFAAGNDGNITYRLSENEVLCTPTMISKGFHEARAICAPSTWKASSSRAIASAPAKCCCTWRS